MSDLPWDGYHWSVQITRFSISTVGDAQQLVCRWRFAIPQVHNEGTLYAHMNKLSMITRSEEDKSSVS